MMTRFLAKRLKKHFYDEADKIDAMPSRNIDDLCAKVEAYHELEREFNKLPMAQRIAVLNLIESEEKK